MTYSFPGRWAQLSHVNSLLEYSQMFPTEKAVHKYLVKKCLKKFSENSQKKSCFRENFQNILEQPSYRTAANSCFCTSSGKRLIDFATSSIPADTDVSKTSLGRLKKFTTSDDQTRRPKDVWEKASYLRRLEDVRLMSSLTRLTHNVVNILIYDFLKMFDL